MECEHEWRLLDKVLATEPTPDFDGFLTFVGDEYRFYCKKCLKVEKRTVPHQIYRDMRIVFNPFEKKKEKKKGFFEVSLSDILNIVTKFWKP